MKQNDLVILQLDAGKEYRIGLVMVVPQLGSPIITPLMDNLHVPEGRKELNRFNTVQDAQMVIDEIIEMRDMYEY